MIYFLITIVRGTEEMNSLVKNKVNKIEALSAAHFTRDMSQLAGGPCEYHLYALTLSSNKAVERNSYRAYDWVVSQLPDSTFGYIHEVSTKGKYHVHGILRLHNKFDYQKLQDSKNTEGGFHFDVHLHYDALETPLQIKKWINYMYSERPKHFYVFVVENAPWGEISISRKVPKTCIPEVTIRMYVKSVSIRGL